MDIYDLHDFKTEVLAASIRSVQDIVDSAKLGITPDVYKEYQCACVVIKSENNFSGSLFIDDEIAISTWITKTDKKVRLSRFFQIINIAKNQTVFTSNVDYACVSLVSFKPVRMPEIYKNSYEVTCNV